jgi:hypothetical protein
MSENVSFPHQTLNLINRVYEFHYHAINVRKITYYEYRINYFLVKMRLLYENCSE